MKTKFGEDRSTARMAAALLTQLRTMMDIEMQNQNMLNSNSEQENVESSLLSTSLSRRHGLVMRPCDPYKYINI